jgi:hypothetical protein
MPGSSVTMERRVPVIRLNSVDFPTFGRPTMTMDGIVSLIYPYCSQGSLQDGTAVCERTARCAIVPFRAFPAIRAVATAHFLNAIRAQ